MNSYWTWFDVDVASGLNAHVRYLADSLQENSCLYVWYLDKPIEIPIHKRCFKTKPTVVSPLIRTSDVGRNELQKISELLDSEGFALSQRRSAKRNFLSQVTAPVPVDNPVYPLRIRSILEIVAEILGQEMPNQVVIGYHQISFSENLPGNIHHDSKAATVAYKLGKKVGSMMRNE